MVNPHNSPWFTPPRAPFIQDPILYKNWSKINHYLRQTHEYYEGNGYLKINNKFFIGKSKTKMRLVSHLDWVYYTPQALALAMDKGIVEEYYEWQLKDPNSDPNIWMDKIKEQELKTHYAQRVGRASKI